MVTINVVRYIQHEKAIAQDILVWALLANWLCMQRIKRVDATSTGTTPGGGTPSLRKVRTIFIKRVCWLSLIKHSIAFNPSHIPLIFQFKIDCNQDEHTAQFCSHPFNSALAKILMTKIESLKTPDVPTIAPQNMSGCCFQ